MSRVLFTAALALAMSPALAQKKSCDELKAEIEAKIKAKGVKTYTVDIVSPAEAKGKTVVGSCEGGAKRIVYKRG